MNDIGVIGLSTMGRNLTYQLMDKKIKVAGYNRSVEAVEKLCEENHSLFEGFTQLNEMIQSLNKPRKVILLIKEGIPTQEMVDYLISMMDEGDYIMDFGNSYYKDSIERYHKALHHGIYFFAIGISGGAKGARYGASVMPSGDKKAYAHIEGLLESISAKVDGKPCCKYIGEIGSGHFVKMVHNAIEYGCMQLITECVLCLRKHHSYEMISDLFSHWNMIHPTYLFEITSTILKTKKGDEYLIDQIEDVSEHKNTGMWTSQYIIEHGLDASILMAAYQARITSSNRRLREIYRQDSVMRSAINIRDLYESFHQLYELTYVQGLIVLKDASTLYGWNLNLTEILSIWRGGCIIQSEMIRILLEVMENEGKDELMNTDWMKRNLILHQQEITDSVLWMTDSKIPCPCFMNGLLYINQLQATLLGANLIQAQRDVFGQHGFRLNESKKVVHYDWDV